jgi:hypothetical protein
MAAGVFQSLSGRFGLDSYVYGWPLPFYDSSITGQLFAGPSSFSAVVLILDVLVIAAVVFFTLFLVQHALCSKRGG